MKWLLRLYPRAWQRRYGEEVAALLAHEPRTYRLVLDLIAGAIDARLNPQWIPASSPAGGHDSMNTILKSCSSSRLTYPHPVRSAALMLGVSLASVLLALGLERELGETVFSQAVLYSGFPIALILSGSWNLTPKPYTRGVRAVLMGLAVVAMYLFFLGVTVLGKRL